MNRAVASPQWLRGNVPEVSRPSSKPSVFQTTLCTNKRLLSFEWSLQERLRGGASCHPWRIR